MENASSGDFFQSPSEDAQISTSDDIAMTPSMPSSGANGDAVCSEREDGRGIGRAKRRKSSGQDGCGRDAVSASGTSGSGVGGLAGGGERAAAVADDSARDHEPPVALWRSRSARRAQGVVVDD